MFRFVQEKEGLGFARGGGGAGGPLRGRAGARAARIRAPRRRASAGRGWASCWSGPRSSTRSYLWESEEAAKAREYLASRGLGEEVLRAFGVGYAPSAWDQVLTRGQRAGFSVAGAGGGGAGPEGAGRAATTTASGRGSCSRCATRGGGCRGSGRGRCGRDSKPKYLNSPEGELYRKSRTLYGIDRARAAIAKAGRAVVVEGYTDVLAAHQAGIEEAVAVMGTAITPEQLQQLSGHAEEVVLALDADRAGRAAMLRAQRVAGSRKLRLRVAAMPAGEDPADMLRGRGGGAGARADPGGGGAAGVPRAAGARRGRPVVAGGRDRALDEVVPVLAAMGESISRDELARVVADRLDADPALVMRRVQRGGRAWGDAGPAGAATEADGSGAAAAPAAPPRPLSARERRERALLAMCIASPDGGAGVPGAADAGAPVVAGGGAGAGIGWRGTWTSR